MPNDPEDFDPYDDEPDCNDCGGEGIVWGEDIASQYDYGWIDEDKMYTCRNCGGSGLRKDMTAA